MDPSSSRITPPSNTVSGNTPGQAGLGARVGELSRSRAEEGGPGAQPYALTGRPERGPREGCDDESALTASEKRRCDTKTSVSHRRYPGGVH